MLRLIQSARLARALMLAAGVLVVTGSFGLHPEPAVALSAAAAPMGMGMDMGMDIGAAWSADSPQSATSHDCPACLTHRPVSIARLAGVPLHTETRFAALGAPEVSRPTSRAARHYKDRAPPAVS